MLFSPGFNLWQYFHTKDGAFVWTEISQNPRRTNENYSDIYFKKSADARKEKLTIKGNYFSPIFTNRTDEILAVYFGSELIPSIRTINVHTKEEKTIHTFTNQEFIGRIAYSDELNACLAVYKSNNELAIIKIDIETGELAELVPKTTHTIDGISVNEDYVYFSSSYTGIDNIFRAPLDGSQKIEQLTSEKIGAYNPSVSLDGQTLYYTSFDELGHQVATQPIKAINSPESFQYLEPSQLNWQDETPSVFENENETIFTKAGHTTYETQPYSKSPFRALSSIPGRSILMPSNQALRS